MKQQLSARSILASTLLGTHPPELPGRLLVALAQEFGVAPGTARVALSRMVDQGELTNSDGIYALAGALFERKQRQDAALAASNVTAAATSKAAWNGEWLQAVIRPGARSANDRAAVRQQLNKHKLAEFREGVWMRPANLATLQPTSGHFPATIAWFRVSPNDPIGLAAELWDLDDWSAQANALTARLEHSSVVPPSLLEGFELSAAALRQFVADPQLPLQLQPGAWPAQALRSAYTSFDQQYRAGLHAFFVAQGGWKGADSPPGSLHSVVV